MTRFLLRHRSCSKIAIHSAQGRALLSGGGPLRMLAAFVCTVGAMLLPAAAQTTPNSSGETVIGLVRPAGPGPTAAPATITLADAIERARKNDAQFLSTVSDAASAREDRLQAKASLLPSVTYINQYLGTQGNGILPS